MPNLEIGSHDINAKCSMLFHDFLLTTTKVMIIIPSVNGLLLLNSFSHSPISFGTQSIFDFANQNKKKMNKNDLLQFHSSLKFNSISLPHHHRPIYHISCESISDLHLSQSSMVLLENVLTSPQPEKGSWTLNIILMGPAFYHQHNILMYICQLGSLFSPKSDALVQTWFQSEERKRAGKKRSKGKE